MVSQYLNSLLNVIIGEWFLLSILSVIFLIYYHFSNTYKFFKRKNIKYLEPRFLVGNLGPRLLLKISIHEFNRYIYNNFKGHPYGGIFEGKRPILMILDQELIKHILIRDFDHFGDRLTMRSKQPAYINRSLLNLKGQEWKSVRSILTPTFSSARLKAMMSLIEHSSTQLVEFLKKHDNEDVELKFSMGHYTLEVIGTCAFGIQCDVLTNKNSKFYKTAETFNAIPIWKRSLILFMLMAMPKALKYMNISFFNPESTNELINILTANKKERRSNSTKSSDFLQLMIDASEIEQEENNGKHNMDDDTIDAQSLLFLLAGYETTSTLLAFAVHVLATHPDIQDRLRSHVEEYAKGKQITYEIISQMNYLDCFLMETLRRYPPVARVDRMCTKRYTLPGSNVNVEVGEVVGIPVYGIHMDPDIYPDPEEFRPERFSDDEKKNRPAHMFLAFGGGPRNCIGLRFAMISAKLAIISLMLNFSFSTCSKTKLPVLFDKKSIFLKPESGLWVHVTSLKAT